VFGQALPQAQTPAESFTQTVLPVLSKNCISCHNDRLQTGGLSLEAFRDPALALQRPEVWAKVLDKVNAGAMPPAPRAPLSAADRSAVMGWIEKNAGAAPVTLDAASADPGRVTARRLNRTEYNNTIRDLLGVSIRPANEFPVDDAGYGFDNIGDVLSLSPLLMEKYMNAARTVSRVAVYGESYPAKPALVARYLPKKFQDDMPTTGNEMPYSYRGAAYGTLHVPVDAEYEIHFRYYNYRGGTDMVAPDAPARGAAAGSGAAAAQGNAPQGGAPADAGAVPPAGRGRSAGAGAGRGGGAGAARPPLTPEQRAAALEAARKAAPPEPVVFNLDGQVLYTYTVEGNGNSDYAHGDDVFRAKLSAGDHVVRVSFPALANLANPRTNVNPDKRRRLSIGYIDVLGPYNASTAPPSSYKKIFVCAERTPACARQIIENLVTRAYRVLPRRRKCRGWWASLHRCRSGTRSMRASGRCWMPC
jgi:hypothetical protein